MAEDRFKILFLPTADRSRKYTTPPKVVPSKDPPVREREQHAARILDRLEKAWDDQLATRAISLSERDGTYLEFLSSSGHDLVLKSLEDKATGMRLMNVRKDVRDGEPIEVATVYIPDNAKSKFLKKIRDYATENVTSGRPKNKALVESIDDIRLALVEAFWTEPGGERHAPAENPEWVEIWINSAFDHDISHFRQTLDKLKIQERQPVREIRFPERTVLLVQANGAALANLIEQSTQIAEFRAAHGPASPLVLASNREQADWTEELLSRTTFPSDDHLVVCVLDTGVNNGHPLIAPVLASSDLHSVEPAWGTDDRDGHGTLMAGMAAYGDLQDAVTRGDTIQLSHRLESSKMIPDHGSNPKDLYGEITAQAIARAEIQAPDRSRIICSAITSDETRTNGHPTSWSGMVDKLASGADEGTAKRRLIVQAAGNIRRATDWAAYPASNTTRQVEDPGQAWNALTVGACTFRDRILDPKLYDYKAVAPTGGLSPFSTTSVTWAPRSWPIKPEVVFEGGNAAIDGSGFAMAVDDLQLLSTNFKPAESLFDFHNATSAATAQASWMAARIQREYPRVWPETLRALLVHSAEWTPAMREQYGQGSGARTTINLLRSCGYGVPNLEKALHCFRNQLTLISEAEIQPFAQDSSNEMHLYQLPWPKDALLDLGESEVKMRVTLSYFIEPAPGEIGWKDRYRYASHGLRFELNSPDETSDEFVRRINAEARTDDDGHPGTTSPKEWIIKPNQRNSGSIHSDIWIGRAADLATSNLIAVHPVIGWWRTRKHLGKSETRTRYSLVVSIESPAQEVDIYTPVMLQIGVPIEVVIATS